MTYSNAFKNVAASICVASGLVFSSAAPVFAQADTAILVRAAEYDDYTRLALEIGADVSYRVEQSDTEVKIIIDDLVEANLTDLSRDSIRTLYGAYRAELDGRTVIGVQVPSGSTVDNFRSGNFLVVDIFTDGREVPNRQQAENQELTEEELNAAATEINRGAQIPTVGEIEEEAPAEGNLISDADPSSNSSFVNRVEETIEFVISDDQAVVPGDVIIKPTALTIPDGIRFDFPFEADINSAVFMRGDVLWIVFDQPIGFNASVLRQEASIIGNRVKRLSVHPHEDALVLRMRVRGRQNITVERDDQTWMVSLKDLETSPRFPLSPSRRLQNNDGQQVFVAASLVGRKLQLEDPVIGDEFVILPLGKPGQGMAEVHRTPSAELMKTAQGIAIVPLYDGIQVERFREGVAIAGQGVDLVASDITGQGVGHSLRLVDFGSWRLGKEHEYRKFKELAQYELSVADDDQRNPARWNLARFYIGHRRGAEALGVLKVMVRNDPSIEQKGDFRAARGIANYLHGRYREAYEDLSVKELDAEQDAELWKTLVTEKLARYEQTLGHYRRGKDLLGTYDPHERSEIQLAVARAAIAMGDTSLAAFELSLIEEDKLNDKQSTEAVFLSAQLNDLLGGGELALVQYEDLSDSRIRDISARARLASILHRLDSGKLDNKGAIDELERLRFAWRGGQFDMKVMLELGGLYVKEGEFAKSLDIYKLASITYPELARELRIGQRMGDIFHELFLGSYSQTLSPLDGITLFYRYQEFTPPGNEGDTMIRRLAERLVTIGLPGDAAELLDYQVRERLEGVPRARIATLQARYYLLDKAPEKALEIIRATREPRLPDDIGIERRQVEARALADMKRFEEAEVLISQDRSTVADLIRADIYWASSDYERAVPTLKSFLGDAWRGGQALNDGQRFNVMRLALAMTFSEDRDGLVTLREQYGRQMRSGSFANSFDVLTRNEQLSGRELSMIASQIADVENLQDYIQGYKTDFSDG